MAMKIIMFGLRTSIKLMNTQAKDGHKLLFCYYCLQHIISEEILKNHAEGCLKINGTQKVKMPYKNKNIFLRNYHKQLMAPFVIFADFECITHYGNVSVFVQLFP